MARRENIVISPGFSRLDRLIRVRDLSPISTVKGLFTSKNILGDCVAYFMMVSVLYGLLTWIPLYLVKEKGFTFMSMGLVASMPCIGGFIGAIFGGYVSDKWLGRRRKPTMMFTAISTVLMMVIMLNIPQSTVAVCVGLFFVGLCLNIGWPPSPLMEWPSRTAKRIPSPHQLLIAAVISADLFRRCWQVICWIKLEALILSLFISVFAQQLD